MGIRLVRSHRPDEAAASKEEKKEADDVTPRGQKRLKGFVPKKIKELQDQAQKVLDLQTERMELQQEEQKEREKLLDIMKEHKVKKYQLDDDYVAEIEYAEEKAYVHKIRKGKRKKAADQKEKD